MSILVPTFVLWGLTIKGLSIEVVPKIWGTTK